MSTYEWLEKHREPRSADSRYNDSLDPVEQIDCEEALAGIIFDALQDGSDFKENLATELSKVLLTEVLWHFKPEVFRAEGKQ